jgi:hypothetical protein
MTAFAEPNSTDKPAWHAGFLALMPGIRDQLRFTFRSLPPEARDDASVGG